VLERCRQHLDALWVLARLSAVTRAAAEEAVIEAVTATVADPAASVAGLGCTWEILSGNCDRLVVRDPRCELEPSRAQRECIALVVSGRRPADVAELTGIPRHQVHQNLNAGLAAIAATSAKLWPR
jgi:hypothetical protein